MRSTLQLTLLLLVIHAGGDVNFALQEKGGRDVAPSQGKGGREATPKKETNKSRNTTAPPSGNSGNNGVRQAKPPVVNIPPPPPLPSAELTINASPAGSVILVNGQERGNPDQNGNIVLPGLKPGPYTIMVRKESYREQIRTITLEPKRREYVSIVLELMPGNLNVTPNINGTEIIISSAETGAVLGRFTERINGLEVVPGRYQVAVSKNGYRTASRDININPGESIFLEPPLERLPVTKPRIQGDARMRVETVKDGKFLLISFAGRSGDTATTVGGLDATLSMNDSFGDAGNISGMLPGIPCQVDFVRIENIAEYSFKESPGPGNGWGRVVVRVRPKDAKRPFHFSITWKVL